MLRALRACPRNAFLPVPHNRPPEAFVDQPVRQGSGHHAKSGTLFKQRWDRAAALSWPSHRPGLRLCAGDLQA